MSGVFPSLNSLNEEFSWGHLYFSSDHASSVQVATNTDFASQQVLNVILKCTRVGRNCSKICFEVAKETICLLSHWFSIAL